MAKPKVAFICVHNSCRSQIAEALGKHLAKDAFESYSAGTEQRDRIHPDAVRLMKQIYGIDMEKASDPSSWRNCRPSTSWSRWAAMSHARFCRASPGRTGDSTIPVGRATTSSVR